MDGVVGFEPTNDGTKSRCLTTWRYPKNKVFVHSQQNLMELVKGLEPPTC